MMFASKLAIITFVAALLLADDGSAFPQIPESVELHAAPTADPKPTPDGISNFLGIGYNIIDGNPEGGDLYMGGVDPGLLVTRPILKLTYDNNQLTSDRQYIIPDQAVFTPRTSCVTTSKQETFYGTESYVDKVAVDVDASARVGGLFNKVKFSGSSRYEEVRAGVDTQHYVYYEERTVCNMGQARYRTELAVYDQYPLDNGFVADACRLRASYNEDLFMAFLEDWGTHVVTKVDLGMKATDRYQETRENFVHYASDHVDNSIKFKGNVMGFRAGVEVDTDVFEAGLTTGMQFGVQTHSYTTGGDDLPEPIAIFLIGMQEVFDLDFWQRFDDHVAAGRCSSSWIQDIATIQSNMELAMSNYAAWKNAIESSEPVIEIPITWPMGTYALQMPNTGCPNSHFRWYEGWRYHDTEDSTPDNEWSDPLHFPGPIWKGNLYQHFCSKVVTEADTYKWPFQPGQYCVLKKGSCPAGLKEGMVHWDDEDTSNDNTYGGEMPDGDYYYDTNIYYCCRDDGFASTPIYMPLDDSFYLLKKNHQCQEVYGMKYTEEYIWWDDNDVANQDYHTGSHPYRGEYYNNVYLGFCYYEAL